MLPVIALVGRPNVGKSTLFNRLTRSRDALVADQPGLTRDRQYGLGQLDDRSYIVVDTGGLSGALEGIEALMVRQVEAALAEADVLVFLVDALDGRNPGDEEIALRLRRLGKPVYLAVNKTDGRDADMVAADFHALGLGEPHPISAAHGRGVVNLMEEILNALPPQEDEGNPLEEDPDRIRVAVVGRPNVGKSTLINRILGEERVLVFDMPGTTRDSVFIPFERDGQRYTLIDTAGVRRRARVKDSIEKFSVIKTLDAIERAHVVVFLFDARQEISEQDANLLGLVTERGRALVLAVNKWDGLDSYQREQIREQVHRRLPFLDFARMHYISALHGSGVGELYDSVVEAFKSATRDMATPKLTAILEAAVHAHQPPLVKGRRIKLRYAHQGGKNPPRIIIHGNQTDALPAAYKRYLTNTFQKELSLKGTPLFVEFRTGDNPYQGKRNTLTQRQIAKRKRLVKFTTRKGR
ncbi:MAG: ribosome biogenesis GTPase Der [Chromatiales bacterium]|nr:ribosome biogenesis GTPase Der [Chromatiales bacterium]